MNTDFTDFWEGQSCQALCVGTVGDPAYFPKSAFRIPHSNESVSQLCLIIKMLRLHFHRQPVIIQKAFNQAFDFRQFIAEEIAQGEQLAFVEV